MTRKQLGWIPGLVAIAYAVIWDIRFCARHGAIDWFACAITLVPGALLLVAQTLALRMPKRSKVCWGITWVLLVPLMLFVLGAVWFAEVMDSTVNANRYEEIRSHLFGKWVAHFPAVVPHHAKNVRMYYQPRFLQGTVVLQLRCVLPPEEVKSVLRKYRPTASEVDYKDMVSDFFRDQSNRGFEALPRDFKVIMLPIRDADADAAGGFAVSTKRNEVIYWAKGS